MVVLCCQSTGLYNLGVVKQMSLLIFYGFHHVNFVSFGEGENLMEGVSAALSSHLQNKPPLYTVIYTQNSPMHPSP